MAFSPDDAAMTFLRYDQDGAVVTLTMDQPEVRHALTGNTAVAEFTAACRRIEEDHSVKVVILTATGSVFSSGGNIRTMQEQLDPAVSVAQLRHVYREGIQRLPLALYNLEVPVIAGPLTAAIGAGCDLACMCDIRIAADTARFAESFVKLGIIPGDGGAWLLPRAIGMSRAAELTFTGDMIDAHQALAWGLVSRVVAADDLMREARDLAQRIAQQSGPALRLSKRLLREGQHTRLDTLLELSAGFQAIAHRTEEHRAAVEAFVARSDTRRP